MVNENEPIHFDAVIERITLELPRFVVYPGAAWDETETFIVDVRLNGVGIGLRNLIPWSRRGWHFGLSESMCGKAGVDTGDHVRVEMFRLGDSRPAELDDLLNSDEGARNTWNALPASDRRDLVLFVASAAKSETRRRRAERRLLR